MDVADETAAVESLLNDRQAIYGNWLANAETNCALYDAMGTGDNYESLPPFVKAALIAIAGKIARIVNGDFTHKDNFRDIAGYANLPLRQFTASATAAECDGKRRLLLLLVVALKLQMRHPDDYDYFESIWGHVDDVTDGNLDAAISCAQNLIDEYDDEEDDGGFSI